LMCMYMKAKAGVQNTLTLNLPIEEARKLQIYSSERSNVYLPKNTNNEYKVLPKSINFIKIHAKTFDPGEKQVIVHAIDYVSGRKVYSWMLMMQSQLPTPTDRKDVVARINTSTLGQYLYTNPTRRNISFEIGSSHPELYSVQESIMIFAGMQTQSIKLDIHP